MNLLETCIFATIVWFYTTRTTGDNVFDNSHDGGWYTAPDSSPAQPGPCTIEVRDGSLTQTEFLDKYAYKAPVIIRGTADNSKFRQVCTKDYLVQQYGDKNITLSSANSHSYSKARVTLNKYVTEMLVPQSLEVLGSETMYWFGDHDYEEWDSFFSLYNKPSYKVPPLTGVYSFGIAGAGSGVPLHFHGPVFAEILYGRKRWFLYPPHHKPTFHPDRSALHWLLEDYPHLTGGEVPLECTVGPGEVLYIPDHWCHGTLNIDTSVFISTFLG